jgi:hypothetical protein
MRGKLTETKQRRQPMESLIRAGAMVTFVSIAWAGVEAAQNTLTLSGERRTVACDGGTLRITGQKNTVTVTGECRKVDISGTNNMVAIEVVAAIEVTGTNNRVTWQRALNGDAPRVSTTGANTVTRATAPAAPPTAPARSTPPAAADTQSAASGTTRAAPAKPDTEPAPPAKASSRAAGTRRGVTPPATTDAAVTVLEDDREDSIDCRGREVSILGSRNTLRLRGSCPMVIVTGSDNELDVDTAQRIRTTGDRNRVVWTSVSDGAATPRIENTGQQNRISKADRKPVSP